MNKQKIMQLEATMEWYSIDDIFTEDVADTLAKWGAKISGAVKKMIAEMKAFAREIESSISRAVVSTKMRIYLNKLKEKAAKGETIYLPDLASITVQYRHDIAELRKDVQQLSIYLNKMLRPGPHPFRNVEDYMAKKDELEVRIDTMIDEMTQAASNRMEITADKGMQEVNKAISTTKLYVSEYTKLISELEKISIQFEKSLAVAEVNYEIKIACKESVGYLGQVKIGATKLCRKSVFIGCALFGI